MKPITVYTTTRITSFLRLAWFKKTLESFCRCTGSEHNLYDYVVIDDSPSPFAQRLVTLCREYGVELVRDFCNTHRVFYAGAWKYILDTCTSPLMLFLPDDIWSILPQEYLSPSIRAFELHSDLFQIGFQCVFSAWINGSGSPNYSALRFYETYDNFVETVHATHLYPYSIDPQNTLWKTALGEYRGVGENLGLNHTLLRMDVLRQYPLPSPHWLTTRYRGKRTFRWLFRHIRSALVLTPGEIEIYFTYHTPINRRYNSGYLNMQTFSYTPDHQPCGIDDIEAFKAINSVRLLSLHRKGTS